MPGSAARPLIGEQHHVWAQRQGLEGKRVCVAAIACQQRLDDGAAVVNAAGGPELAEVLVQQPQENCAVQATVPVEETAPAVRT